MYQIVLLFHVLLSVALIGLVLIQQGKGASMGSAFGAGASQTVFGSQGSGSFMLKLTGGLAALFFCTSIFLAYLMSSSVKQAGRVIVNPPPISAPATTEQGKQ